jgi:hypothetical protein
MPHKSEQGITNLGPVPDGMTFWEASQLALEQRKFAPIDPLTETNRLTLCETVREIYRETRKSEPDMAKIRTLCALSFEYGKRMDARMKELRKCSGL